MYKVLVKTKDMTELEWLKSRQHGIGGSDAGAIIGVNKWRTPFQVYMDKTQEINEPSEQSEAAYWGTELEDLVAREFSKRTGKKVRRRNAILQSTEYPFMTANLDREVAGEKSLLECKTVNAFGAKEWDSDEIPASYLVQVMHYLAVTGYEKAYIAVLIGGQKFLYKEVDRDEELIKMIIDAEKNFWENFIVKKVPPPLDGSTAAEKYLRERYSASTPETSVNLKSEYKDKIKDYFELKNTIKDLELQAKKIENNIKLELGEAEVGYAPDYEIDWKSITSNRFDSKGFRKDHPELFKEYLNTSSYRKFSIKEVKA
ncbi:lambda-exonuclease family protein [Clostridium sp. JN-1]|uniref:YqaJ viral recombinase family nuclease n=1 Tax=Clostridium sp. JN-1 TaxID=2483110 RepID=UPI001FA959BD|nr:YqaJ viral recombinase family protein [Clostridium sp. JN-1]